MYSIEYLNSDIILNNVKGFGGIKKKYYLCSVKVIIVITIKQVKLCGSTKDS